MTATTTKTDNTSAIDKLTDQAIKVEIGKLARMISNRQEDIATLNHEIAQLQAKRDTLVQASIDRLRAQLSASGDNDSE